MATINGSLTGSDQLHGTNGSDIMNGFSGDDRFFGSAGADTINGGSGVDTVDYSTSARGGNYAVVTPYGIFPTNINGVLVDLSSGHGYWGDALGDSYDSIENVTGSAWNDAISGGRGDNVIYGGAGDDLIEGLDGADTLAGGTGNDTLSYERSNAAVKIDLQYNTATGGHATGDTISGFEGVIGSDYGDILSGSSAKNFIEGGEGADSIAGQAGDDTLIGDAGNDVINGGSENDRIDGGADSDKLTGGSGIDTFVFNGFDNSGGVDTIMDFQAGVDKIEFHGLTPSTATINFNTDPVNQQLVVQYLSYDGTIGTILFEGVTSGAQASLITQSFEFL